MGRRVWPITPALILVLFQQNMQHMDLEYEGDPIPDDARALWATVGDGAVHLTLESDAWESNDYTNPLVPRVRAKVGAPS